MEPQGRSELAARYACFLQELARRDLVAAEPAPVSLPSDAELECLWVDGLLPGNCCETVEHGHVVVRDHGCWNRGDGPDFLHAELEIGGVHLSGDIVLSHTADEWDTNGCGNDARYNNVVLHVVFAPPPPQWYTRSEQHRHIPLLYIPEEVWRLACGICAPLDGQELLPAPLAHLPLADVVNLMQAAAAHRVEYKRRLFRVRAAVAGEAQAWYEALASTLGYSANKQAMSLLARRAPLHVLGEQAEAILFGVADFLLPVLPERAGNDARAYHRGVWDAWWPLRSQHGLAACRHIPWKLSAGRPLNHPHRRVAALAMAARRWREIESLLSIAGSRELTRVLSSLSHPYWDWHCSLPSAPLARAAALMGQARIRDFLLNHVYVQDDAAGTWQAYLCLGASDLPPRVAGIARQLFGARRDVEPLFKLCFAQQALLQLERDWAAGGAYPAALASWRA